MNLGEYLKSCREFQKRTQPDVAGEIEIEQSYLSKIESGKSIPSNDIFNKLVKVYEIEVEDLISQLEKSEFQKLRDLKAITNVMSQKNKERVDFAKKFSIIGLILLTVGAGLLCFAILPDRSEPKFSYRSEGVLTVEEDLNTFDLVYKEIEQLNQNSSLLAKRTELLGRLEQKDVLSDVFRGDGYVVNTADGRRFFKLIGKQESVRNFWNRWFLVPSFMFIVAGFGCFFLSKRWSKRQLG